MNKPPLLFVIFGIAFFIYAQYEFYQLWFKPQKYLNRWRKLYYKLPDWYPLKELLIATSKNGEDWIAFYRIMSVVGELFIIYWLAEVLLAWFTGK